MNRKTIIQKRDRKEGLIKAKKLQKVFVVGGDLPGAGFWQWMMYPSR